jgi:hypothetical protein
MMNIITRELICFLLAFYWLTAIALCMILSFMFPEQLLGILIGIFTFHLLS